MIRQFAYVHRVAKISLLSKKSTEVQLQFFSLSEKHSNHKLKNPNHQSRFPHTKRALKIFPKPPLHRLSPRKSPIKNHATLFKLGQVVKSDQTKLGSTKPNKSSTWRLVQSPTSNRNPPKNNLLSLQLILLSSS